MMPTSRSVLITGGAGFIGSSLARWLVGTGAEVVVLDVLHPQVHAGKGRPARLPSQATLLPVDVCSDASWDAVLQLWQPDCIIHLAAETGTGQSLVEASRHGIVNVVGTTRMTDALQRHGVSPSHVLLASSRAVYGEGLWSTGDLVFSPGPRRHEDLLAGRWEPVGPGGEAATPMAHRASSVPAAPSSVYGATKLTQEHVLTAWASATGVPLTILRMQNAYGPGQAPGNSYTGVVTLFAELARRGQVIDVFEDGEIVRDFVHIDDIVAAFSAAFEQPPSRARTLDIGSGEPVTIMHVAKLVADLFGAPPPRVSGRFRDGDVRSAWADIEQAKHDLGYRPRVALEDGLVSLVQWLGESVSPDQDPGAR